MKTSTEKEKKLNDALSKLINLNLNTNLKENLQHLSFQKNQLVCLMHYRVFFLFHYKFSYIYTYIIKSNLLSLDRIIFEQTD